MGSYKKGNTVVFGIFRNRGDVEYAIDTLKERNFRSSDVSVLMPNPEGSQELAHEKGTKAPEGATTGATSGAMLGGALGWLVGIGALAIPGIGPFVAAGPIISALAGAGVGGALGGVTGALVGMGIPEYEAKRYESYMKDGGLLISVHADDGKWASRAKEILESCGGTDVASASEEKSDSSARSTDRPIFASMRRDDFIANKTNLPQG